MRVPRSVVIVVLFVILVWRVAATDSLVAGLLQTIPPAIFGLLISRGRTDQDEDAEGGPAPAPAGLTPAPATQSGDDASGTRPEPAETPQAVPEIEQAAARLLGECTGFCDAIAVHCWQGDSWSPALRRVGSAGHLLSDRTSAPHDFGPGTPDGQERLSAFAVMRTPDQSSRLWRFSHLFRAGDSRIVLGVDVRSEDEPDTRRLSAAVQMSRDDFLEGLELYPARELVDTTKMLLEAARRLSTKLHAEEIAEEALQLALSISDAENGSVMLLDDPSGEMRIVASQGLSDEVAAVTRVREGEGIAGWVLMTGDPVLVHDQETSHRTGYRDKRSAISVPIEEQGRVLGVLNVSAPRAAVAFRKRDLEALRLLGNQIASALDNAQTLRSARELYLSALRALALALETKDPYAQGTTDQVAEYATLLATRLGLGETEREALKSAALLHDIGMPPVRDAAPSSSAPLTAKQRQLVDMHPALAAEILHEVPALQIAIPIVYHHHEWFDGRGYVAGLSGDAIPIGARVLAVADAFVAMTSQRPYRVTMTPEEALAELRAKSGTQFDPVVVEAFVALMGEDRA